MDNGFEPIITPYLCKKCGVTLDTDDIGVYKKIINRMADNSDCFCKSCLADYCGCDLSIIQHKIEQFKEYGCLLFYNGKL